MSEWLSPFAWGLVATFVVGGVALAASTKAKPGLRGVYSWHGLGWMLIYLPVCYVFGGLMGLALPASDPATNAGLLGLWCLSVHLLTRRLPLVDDEIRLGSGITDVCDDSADQFRNLLAQDLAELASVKVVAPDLAALLAGPSTLGMALRHCSAEGTLIQAIGDGSDLPAGDTNLPGGPKRLEIVGNGRVEASASWTIVATQAVAYFALRPPGSNNKNGHIYRVEASRPGESGRLGDGVLALVDSLFRWGGRDDIYVPVKTSSSPEEYRKVIIPAEAGANRIDRVPKRLSVVFKSPATVRSIAEGRYGYGSPSIQHYTEEHDARRQEFFTALGRGMACREVYNAAELIEYVSSRRHGSVLLTASEMIDTLSRWRAAVENYERYFVAITRDPLPFKYEVVDTRLAILHEAVGINDLHRLNGIILQGRHVGASFLRDFETIWDRVDANLREKTGVLSFIDGELFPLVNRNEGVQIEEDQRLVLDSPRKSSKGKARGYGSGV